jgi:hypothetical protein
MEKKAFWDKKNPNKKSTPLSPKQKASAKARAKARESNQSGGRRDCRD